MSDQTKGEFESASEPPGTSRKLHTVGFVITGVWLTLLVIYFIWKFESFESLEPNAVGDFTAGAFAPLAFLWLVLGFFQQGVELRNSGKALWLQGEELRNSVEQQRALVNVTKEQLAFDAELLRRQQDEVFRSSRPVFNIRNQGSAPTSTPGKRRYMMALVNHGRPCTAVFMTIRALGRSFEWDAVDTGVPQQFELELNVDEPEHFEIRIDYTDQRLLEGTALLDAVFEDSRFYINAREGQNGSI